MNTILNCISVTDFGVVGDGVTNDTEAVQKAIDACYERGGGTVVIPTGYIVKIGTIHLKSFVDLYLQRKSKLLLSENIDDFDINPFCEDMRVGIFCESCQSIAITGFGSIDGNGKSYISERLPDIHKTKSIRPLVICFKNCKDISIKDCKIVDAPVWTINLTSCYNVTIHNISIYNDMNMPNSDGIDVDRCKYVRISDSHFECGDDCIVIKTHKYFGGSGCCEDVVVTNCTMTSKSFAINLGCEVDTPIRNCVFSNCIISDSHRGVGVHLSQHSNIENVIFSDLIIQTRYYPDCWWGAAEPIYVVSIPWTKNDSVGYIKNIMFKNIYCTSENGAIVYGDKTAVIQDVTFSDVHITLNKLSEYDGGRFDLRPCDGEGNGFNTGVYKHNTSGFHIENTRNVKMNHCGVIWGDNIPEYFNQAIVSINNQNFTNNSFSSECNRKI